MKFCKKYLEFIEREGQRKLPGLAYVRLKRFKKILKKCPAQNALRGGRAGTRDGFVVRGSDLLQSEASEEGASTMILLKNLSVSTCSMEKSCPPSCPVCDGNFFPELMEEVSAVLGCFNACAKQLLERHLSRGLKRFMLRLRHKVPGDHAAIVEEGRALVSYASINAMAIRKILKKYDKVHCASAEHTPSKQQLLAKRVELLQSPWLIELFALHMNLAAKDSLTALPEGFKDCACDFENVKPTISCTLFDSFKMEVDLTCSICLETLFDPMALGCGHVYCNSCLCSAASVPAFLGVEKADKCAKCPLCRQEDVYEQAVRLPELGALISNRCKEYWNDRLHRERVEQVQEAKLYWEKQLQAAMGL